MSFVLGYLAHWAISEKNRSPSNSISTAFLSISMCSPLAEAIPHSSDV